ncbi:MAG TPA: SET domain-containing protein-lysine N-methyltransferase [Micavibrio sp.]|nr:SET domain-containing protein-lysine N-methyltransferase [Micavibrio sp.]
MYRVKVYVDRSPIHGLGVFAGEDIKKGEVVWEMVRGFDRVYTQAEYESFPEQARKYLDTYAYWDGEGIHLCGDQGIYTNHSETPNVGSVAEWPDPGSDYEYALRDIAKGEEITSDYRVFDDISKHDFKKVLGVVLTKNRMKKAA